MAGHVYLIGSRKFHWFKIGKSSRASVRVSELGILLPFRVEVIAIWKSEDHHALERELHLRNADCRINGEWFSFTNDRMNSLLMEMKDHKTEIAAKFSNMEKDVLQEYPLTKEVQKRIKQLVSRIPKVTPDLENLQSENRALRDQVDLLEGKGGYQKRINILIKQKCLLQERLKKLESYTTIQ